MTRGVGEADGKMNEMVSMNNFILVSGGKKRLVIPFRRKEFCKCIGCIISAFTYGKKGHTLWSKIPKTFGNKPPTKLHIVVLGNTDLNKVCCDIYNTY